MMYDVGLIQGARDDSQADVVMADSVVVAFIAPWIVLSSAVLARLP